MNSKLWGPEAWRFLHCVTLGYGHPETGLPTADQRAQMAHFFKSLPWVLPCDECRKHFYQVIYHDDPVEPHLGSRQKLAHWLVGVHNQVNTRLGKPTRTFESVCKDIFNQSPCRACYKCYRGRWIILIVVLLLVIAVLACCGTYWYWKKNCLNVCSRMIQ